MLDFVRVEGSKTGENGIWCRTREFCGFGAAVTDLRDPPVQWKGTDTYIQKEGINADFGIFNSPDDFYRKHGTNLSGLKKWVFETVVRAQMNRNVEQIRLSKEES